MATRMTSDKTPQNPDWTRDEHILALDLYLSAKPGQPQNGGQRVVALSDLLNRLHRKLGTQGSATLRNPAWRVHEADEPARRMTPIDCEWAQGLRHGAMALKRGCGESSGLTLIY